MTPQVWSRFEKKRDGSMMKLRIQDLPPERFREAADLMVKYFVTEEPYRKATGFPKNPKALEEYRDYINRVFRDPAGRNVMCCADTDDDAPDIMGISCIAVETELHQDKTAETETEEMKKYNEICADFDLGPEMMKKFNISCYYADKSMLVLPQYRGNCISQQFLTVRRIMCAVHGTPMTGAWVSSHATQIAAKRDGWEIYYEMDFDQMSQRYGITFENVPYTDKFVVAGPHPDYVTKYNFK